jgi:hypothetical protein
VRQDGDCVIIESCDCPVILRKAFALSRRSINERTHTYRGRKMATVEVIQ